MENLKIGDTVYLNSNPEVKLTITYLPERQDEYIELCYFNSSKGDFSFAKFPREALSLVKSSK